MLVTNPPYIRLSYSVSPHLCHDKPLTFAAMEVHESVDSTAREAWPVEVRRCLWSVCLQMMELSEETSLGPGDGNHEGHDGNHKGHVWEGAHIQNI